MNAILVHGWSRKDEYYNPKYPTSSNSHWLPWLSKQLMIRDIHTVAAEMPNSYNPNYFLWKKEFERYDIDSNTILVGHSCGGGFLVRWLSEVKDMRVGKVILVAPWIGIRPDQDFDKTFFNFQIDHNIIDKTDGLVIFNSSNDVSEIQDSVEKLLAELRGVKLIVLENKGHFTERSLVSLEFPELLHEIIG